MLVQPAPPGRIRILIVDDHPILRGGLRKLLELEPDLDIIAEAGTGQQALEIIAHSAPDVVLLDVNLPDVNGLQVVTRLRALGSQAGVIVMTAYDDPAQEWYALRSGSSAYCPKAVELDRLVEVIREVARGHFVIGGKVYNQGEVMLWLAEQDASTTASPHPDDDDHNVTLSQREMQILQCVARGMSNKAIALELGISHQTVRNHMTSILGKLHVEGRTQAALYAVRRGWVNADTLRPSFDE